MLGEVSEGDNSNEPIASAGRGRQQQPQVQQQPKGSHDARGAHQGPDQRSAIAKAAAGKQEVQHTARADASAAAGDAMHGTSDREGHKEGGTEAGYEHGGSHKEEGQLGRKQKRGKKRKPESQLQRMQAQVQAKKASSCCLLHSLRNSAAPSISVGSHNHRPAIKKPDILYNGHECCFDETRLKQLLFSASSLLHA